jgi:hypothetical protein
MHDSKLNEENGKEICHRKYNNQIFVAPYRILMGKARRKEAIGRPRSRLVNNIKINLTKTGWGCMDFRALANAVINLWIP